MMIHKTQVEKIFPLSFTHYSFLLLFIVEFTYYLLILQTGIVEYHHSNMTEVWMVPVGGILGIISSIWLYRHATWMMPLALFFQLILSYHYAEATGIELFFLGYISGLTAPILIYNIKYLWFAVLGLAFSYALGTLLFPVPAIMRTDIALILSIIALLASFFVVFKKHKPTTNSQLTLYSMGSVFLWLLLDASLFESLSRNTQMHIWGDTHYTLGIIIFHIVGLLAAYLLRTWKYTDMTLLLLFTLSYFFYTIEDKVVLSVLYPVAISYYNVIILYKLMKLPYMMVAVMSLSLWGASGLGLFIALSEDFALAWIILAILAMFVLLHHRRYKPLVQNIRTTFTSYKGKIL